jgi:hypothetical protein
MSRLLHLVHHKLGGGSKKKKPRSENISIKNQLQKCILHFKTALKTAMQLLDEAITIIMLQLTFGGAPCPFKWGIMSESICNLANELLKCKDWNPEELHLWVQQDAPQWQYLDDDVPFASSRELIVNVPIDPRG